MKKTILIILSLVMFFGLIACEGDGGTTDISIIVHFDTMGGNEIDDMTVLIDGSNINLPTPTKVGHSFVEWYLDSELVEEFLETHQPETDITVYAKWEVNEYTITFDSNSGTSVDPITQDFLTNVVKPTDPTKEGHEFLGWYSNSSLTEAYEFTTMPAKNITLFAKWQGSEVTVTFVNDEVAVEPLAGFVGNPIIIPKPNKAGKEFLGWYLESTFDTLIDWEVFPEEDITVYGKWEDVTYKIYYETNGGSLIPDSIHYYQEELTAPTNPTKLGHTFVGWYKTQTFTVPYEFTTMPDVNFMIYAKWQVNEYTISFKSNYGSAVAPITQQYLTTVLAPNDPVKMGYEFEGWYSNESLTMKYVFTTMPAENITLHANWVPVTYNITYETNGGSVIDSTAHYYNQAISAPSDPNKLGYVFIGWFSDLELTTEFIFTTMPAADITIYANWAVESPYLIRPQIMKEPGTIVTIEGVVYGKMKNSMFGFYVYDQSAFVKINHPHLVVDIGEKILLTGTLGFVNESAVIEEVSQIVTVSNDNLMPVAPLFNFTDIDLLTTTDAYKYYEIEGIVKENGIGGFMITDILTNTSVNLNPLSYDHLDNFGSNLDNEINAKIIVEFELEDILATIIQYTITELDNLAKTTYIEKLVNEEMDLNFKPGQRNNINRFNPFNNTDLLIEVPIEYQQYYDSDKRMFLYTEDVVTIPVTVTVNFNEDMGPMALLNGNGSPYSFIINTTLTPIELSTVSALNNDSTKSYHNLMVMVVSKTDQSMLLKDNTGLFYAKSSPAVNVGDIYIVKVRNDQDYSITYISGYDGSYEHILTISTENDLDLLVTTYTIEQILQKNKNDMNIYGEYVEVSGILTDIDHEDFYGFGILDNEQTLQITAHGHQGFESLTEYYSMKVNIKGFLFANEYGDITLYYEGIREDIELIDYNDQEKVDLLYDMFNFYFLGETFDSFDEFEVGTYHPTIGTDISWGFVDENFAYFDYENSSFTYSKTDVPFTMTFTITSGLATKTFNYNSVLNKAVITDFADLSNVSGYSDVFIEGTIIFRNNDFAYIMDDTGLIINVTQTHLDAYIGDRVLLYGRIIDGHSPQLRYITHTDDQALVQEIISRNNPTIITPNMFTIEDILAKETYNEFNNDIYVELEGKLVSHGNNELKLQTVNGDIYLSFPYEIKRIELLQEEGSYVKLRGFINGRYYDSNYGMYFWNLMYVGNTGDLEVVSYTNATKFNAIKDYIIANYEVSAEAQTTIDFTQVKKMHEEIKITYNPIDPNNLLSSTATPGLYYIENTFEEVLITIDVILDDLLGDTFNFSFTLTVTRIKEDTYADISQLVADETVQSVKGIVIVAVNKTNTTKLFLIEDLTGKMYVELPTEVYNSSQLYYEGFIYSYELGFFGTVSIVDGNKVMSATSVNVINGSSSLDIEFTPMTYMEISEVNFMDPNNIGLPVSVNGTLEYARIDYVDHYYLVYDNVPIEVYPQANWNYVLSYHKDLRVMLKGFLYYENGTISLMYQENVYGDKHSIEIGPYTNKEVLALIKDEILTDVNEDNRIFELDERIYFPNVNQRLLARYNPQIDYEIIYGADYVTRYGNGYLEVLRALEDVEIAIEVTITLGLKKEVFTYYLYINGFETMLIADLFDTQNLDTKEIALEATVIHTSFGLVYLLIQDHIYKVPTMMYGGLSMGDAVIVIGQRSVINGIAEYTYNVRLLNNGPSEELVLNPVTTTIAELYTNDYLTNPIHYTAHTISGYLQYDEQVNLHTLTDNNQMVYVRFLRANWSSENPLPMYVEEYVSLDVILSQEVLRDEYYVVDLYDEEQGVRLKVYTPQEELAYMKQKFIDYGEVDFYSGDRLNNDLPSVFIHHPHVNISYELQDVNDALYFDPDTLILNGGDNGQTIIMTATLTHDLNELITESFDLTINIHTPVTSSIYDVLHGMDNIAYKTKGVIIAFGPNKDYAIIDDGANRINVNLSNVENFAFYGQSIVLALGDEIEVTAIRNYYDTTKMVPMLDVPFIVSVISSANTVTNTLNVLTIKQLHALRKDDLMNNYQYVKITGKLVMNYSMITAPAKYSLVISDLLTNDYLEHLRVYFQIEDLGLDLSQFEGQELTIKGYIVGYNTLNNLPKWVMVYEGHTIPLE